MPSTFATTTNEAASLFRIASAIGWIARDGSGTAYTALRDLDIAVGEGEFCAVVGPTGCGKSTTLALISGLEPTSEGEVYVHGEPVRGVGRNVGYVFQVDAVFPWKNVLDNVAT